MILLKIINPILYPFINHLSVLLKRIYFLNYFLELL